MGSGLVGDFAEGSVKTVMTSWVTLLEIFPEGKPKKASLFVDLSEMDVGDTIWTYVMY
jgi:hypothetical protein